MNNGWIMEDAWLKVVRHGAMESAGFRAVGPKSYPRWKGGPC